MTIEEIVFSIIVNAGDARAKSYEALKYAENGEFDKADKMIIEAEEKIGEAHKVQTSVISKESSGEKIELSVLFVHCQDHLMTAISEKGLIENMIKLNKRIYLLEQR